MTGKLLYLIINWHEKNKENDENTDFSIIPTTGKQVNYR